MKDVYVVFDLDGTLVDSAPDLHASLNHCLTAAGRETIDIEKVRHMVGQGAVMLLRRGLSATGGLPSDSEFDELVQLFFDYYAAHLTDFSQPYAGVVNALNSFSEAGTKMGVCTNKPIRFADPLLEELGLSNYFSAVTGGDTFAVRKPDAAHLTGTLKEMGYISGPSFMVGDSESDILAAQNAGIPSIAVSFGYTVIPVSELGPDHIIDHFDSLFPLISRLI